MRIGFFEWLDKKHHHLLGDDEEGGAEAASSTGASSAKVSPDAEAGGEAVPPSKKKRAFVHPCCRMFCLKCGEDVRRTARAPPLLPPRSHHGRLPVF
jgi:hypothetical protein